ncbi:Inhibitor of growth protein 1 [Echinococcus granulosus]|nr:Inhibitor of growth protein 1 [Echinococcus granulosus]
MIDGGLNAYFTNYLATIQELPRLLQRFFTSSFGSDVGQNDLINSIESALTDLSENKNTTNLEALSSMIITMNNAYDARLGEMGELLETLEQILQFLSQSKSTLHANDEQQLKNLIKAFTPGDNGPHQALIPLESTSPPPPPQPPIKSARRVIHQHHRPSPSQILLRGTKWISARRNAASSARGGPFRGVRNRVMSSVHPSRSRITDLHRRDQVPLEQVMANRPIKAPLSPSSISSSSDSEEYNRPRPRLRCTSSPLRSRKREVVGTSSTAVDVSGERLYCLCKKLSYGDMIACDNPRCEIEWFHFACVEIKTQPKGRWYCPRCRGESSKVKRVDA